MKLVMSILLFLVMALPKITIINFNGSSTGIRLEDFLIAFFVLLFIIYKKKNSIRFSKEIKNIIKVFFWFSFFGLLSCLYGSHMEYVDFFKSIFFLLRKVEYFLFLLLGFYYAKNEKLERTFAFIVFFHFIVSMFQYLGWMGSFKDGVYMTKLAQGRITSTFNGSYEYGAFLLLILPYFMNKIFSKGAVKKTTDLLCLILLTVCIIMSESRTSLVIELFIAFLIMKREKIFFNRKVMSKLIILLFFMLPFILIIFNRYSSRFDTLNISGTKFIISYAWNNKDFESYKEYNNWYGTSSLTVYNIAARGYDGSFYQRVSHWFQLIDGLNLKRLNWWIGLGVSISGNSADGNYIRILAENGLVGLFLWIVLMRKVYFILKSNKEYSFYIYSLISVLLGAIFIDLFEASKIMMLMWFIIGYVGYKNMEGDSHENKEYCNN